MNPRAVAFGLSLMSLPVQACDLALVLAVDVSGSVDAREYRVQMDGLAEALRDGIVVDALVDQQAMVSLIQWTGTSRQKRTVDWRQMVRASDVLALADAETDLLRWPLNPGVDAAEWARNAGQGLPPHALAVLELAMAPVTFSPERLAATLEDAPRWARVNAAKTVIEMPMEGSNNWVISGARTAS